MIRDAAGCDPDVELHAESKTGQQIDHGQIDEAFGPNKATKEKDEKNQCMESISALPGIDDDSGTSSHLEKVNVESHRSRSNRFRHSEVGGAGKFPAASCLSTDPQGNTYPEGGLEAYAIVMGSCCILFGALGLANSLGTFQAWLSTHQLKDHSQASIGWIFGVYAFLMFFGGVQVGPVFDAKGPRLLVLAGTVLTIASVVLLGFCQRYWQFMITFGVLCGIGTSLLFAPAIACIGHWFYRRRGRATGLATTGGSLGGVMFPLLLENLFPKIGFAWATRVVALISLLLMAVGCWLVKSRLPKKRTTKENILPDLGILLDASFALVTLGIFFAELGIFIPITFISSYALSHDISQKISYQLLAFLNVGSVFGRALPGFTADYVGRFNAMIVTVLLSLLSTACLWLPAGNSVAMLVVYTLVFGFASGSNISLAPVCVGQICKTEHYGRYYATSYTVASLG